MLILPATALFLGTRSVRVIAGESWFLPLAPLLLAVHQPPVHRAVDNPLAARTKFYKINWSEQKQNYSNRRCYRGRCLGRCLFACEAAARRGIEHRRRRRAAAGSRNPGGGASECCGARSKRQERAVRRRRADERLSGKCGGDFQHPHFQHTGERRKIYSGHH